MRRREFITLVGSAMVAWPLAARAQQPDRVRRIGVLVSGTESDPENQARLAAFRQELNRFGWSEDRREVVMSEQHAELLKKARERLVEDRRSFAKIIAAPFERERTSDARTRFIEMQTAIEAVDRAIEDEEDDDATV